MAITLFTETWSTEYAYASYSGAHVGAYVNKVWDTVLGGWVRWATDVEDVTGRLYPGPGVFGVDTADFRIESVVFSTFNL